MKTTVRGGPQGPPPGLILILMKCTTRKPHRSSLRSAGPGIAAPPCSATTPGEHVFRVHPNRKPPASPSEKKLGDRRGRPPSASKDPGDVNDLHEALDELRRRPTVRRPRPTSTTEVSPAHHTTSAVSTTIKAQVGISWDGEVDSAIVQWDKQNWSPHGPVPVVHATAAAALPN